MANIEDIKERLRSELTRTWERIQESSIYIQASDRFENLSPIAQKGILTGAALLVVVMIMLFPLSTFWSGSDEITTYETQRDLIRDLFKIQQESQSSLGLSPGPSGESLVSQIEDELRQSRLLPEQMAGVGFSEIPTQLPKSHIESALRVALHKLNLRQIIDLGHQISSIHPTIKMTDLSIEANASDSRYFDVVYKFVSLKIPVYQAPQPEEETPKNKKNMKLKEKAGDE